MKQNNKNVKSEELYAIQNLVITYLEKKVDMKKFDGVGTQSIVEETDSKVMIELSLKEVNKKGYTPKFLSLGFDKSEFSFSNREKNQEIMAENANGNGEKVDSFLNRGYLF